MSCSSPELLTAMAAEVERRVGKTDPDAAADIAWHLQRAVASHASPLPLFRTLEDADLKHTVPYAVMRDHNRMLLRLSISNCHNGQKKLAFSVLEFVLAAMKRLGCGPDDLFVVYAGASGMASVVTLNVFPGLQMLLYDPAANTVQLMPRYDDKVIYYSAPPGGPDLSKSLIVYTGRAGYFDDAAATAVRKLCTRKHLVFVSDVRMNADEASIRRDMMAQQRWAVLSGCAMYMFKFRIPYLWNADVRAQYVAAAARAGLVPPLAAAGGKAAADDAGCFPYLDGAMHVQLYGRQQTGELRLIGAAEAPGKTYRSRMYRIGDIEDQMAMFNLVYRHHARFQVPRLRSFGAVMGANIPATYEAMAEYAIVHKCAAAALSKGSPKVAQVAKMRALIDDLIATHIVFKEWLSCPFRSAEQYLRGADDETVRHLDRCATRLQEQFPDDLPSSVVDKIRDEAARRRL